LKAAPSNIYAMTAENTTSDESLSFANWINNRNLAVIKLNGEVRYVLIKDTLGFFLMISAWSLLPSVFLSQSLVLSA
jgi:hypothetical protein